MKNQRWGQFLHQSLKEGYVACTETLDLVCDSNNSILVAVTQDRMMAQKKKALRNQMKGKRRTKRTISSLLIPEKITRRNLDIPIPGNKQQ